MRFCRDGEGKKPEQSGKKRQNLDQKQGLVACKSDQDSIRKHLVREGESRNKRLEDFNALNRKSAAMKSFLDYTKKERAVNSSRFYLHKKRLIDRLRVICGDLDIRASFIRSLVRSESFEEFIEVLVGVCKTFESEIQEQEKSLKTNGIFWDEHSKSDLANARALGLSWVPKTRKQVERSRKSSSSSRAESIVDEEEMMQLVASGRPEQPNEVPIVSIWKDFFGQPILSGSILSGVVSETNFVEVIQGQAHSSNGSPYHLHTLAKRDSGFQIHMALASKQGQVWQLDVVDKQGCTPLIACTVAAGAGTIVGFGISAAASLLMHGANAEHLVNLPGAPSRMALGVALDNNNKSLISLFAAHSRFVAGGYTLPPDFKADIQSEHMQCMRKLKAARTKRALHEVECMECLCYHASCFVRAKLNDEMKRIMRLLDEMVKEAMQEKYYSHSS